MSASAADLGLPRRKPRHHLPRHARRRRAAGGAWARGRRSSAWSKCRRIRARRSSCRPRPARCASSGRPPVWRPPWTARPRCRRPAGGVPVSGFSLADLEALAAREPITLRALLEELKAAGLELVADAPLDRLQDARRSIEEVNIAGLDLARATLEETPAGDLVEHLRSVAELQRRVAVIRAFAPLPRHVNAYGADHRVRRREARGAGAADRGQRAVDSGGLAALRPEARAGRADDGRRRPGRRVVRRGRASDGRRRAPLEDVRRNIQAAGQEPVERNGRFEPIARPVRRSLGEGG